MSETVPETIPGLKRELELTRQAIRDASSAFERVMHKLQNKLAEVLPPGDDNTWADVVAAVDEVVQTNKELTTELNTYRKIISLGSQELAALTHFQDLQNLWKHIEALEKRLPPLQETGKDLEPEQPRCPRCYYPLPASSGFCPSCGHVK